ncbi:histidine kinase N-terminal 7TM domain-containing protein [Salinispira pacifica]|uniref:histidine kinase n=1 Tax=Salinispira pacifica TaxID=1307761 RepID=V5WMP6_9SPIO|nr:histidine kinase N-terminal 7TM domain-containing protein [Salinispira pacifica]AHC16456.1 hypothetical protein L21SP2_3114 [Salinispira pacifica]
MEYTMFLILAPIALGIIIVTQVVLWRYRREAVGKALMVYFVLAALLVITNILELIAESETWTYNWAVAQFPFYSALPVVWLHFAFSFTQARISRKRLLWGFLSVVPVLSTLLVLSARQHGLIYVSVDYLTRFGVSTVEPEYGLWFWFNGAFHYALLLFGALIIIRYIILSDRVYANRAFWVIAGVSLPLVVNMLYLLPLSFLRYKDFTPIAFAVTGVFFFIGVFWQRMLQIVPRARNLVIDSMDQAVLIFDTGGVLVDINSASEALLNVSGKNLGLQRNEIPLLVALLGDTDLNRSRSFERQLEMDGRERHFDVYVRPIRSLPGRSVAASASSEVGTLVMISDISEEVLLSLERLALLDDARRANEELKETQMRLIHREKLASIGQISAGLAHEMRNPVGYLQSNFRVLRKKLEALGVQFENEIPSDQLLTIRELLQDSEEGFQRILAVVDNLLHFSRPGKREEMELYDLNRGIRSTLEITRELMQASRRIDLEARYAELPPVSAYSGEINQVILNLITNAVHAVQDNSERPPRISIETFYDNDTVGCRICNNGSAIPEEIREQIFEPFFTTKDSGSRTAREPGWD